MTTLHRDRGAARGIYNPVTLRMYDAGVLGLTNTAIWRCPTRELVDHYRQHTGARHLDIGPGTGYYLQRIDPEVITLLDLNPSSLARARSRIGDHIAVDELQQSYFDPIDPGQQWDSIALNFLLHCIPDRAKWDRLARLRENLCPGGTIFGSTVITDPATATVLARTLEAVYQRIGVFGNAGDTTDDLAHALAGWDDLHLQRRGQCILFSARRPHTEEHA